MSDKLLLLCAWIELLMICKVQALLLWKKELKENFGEGDSIHQPYPHLNLFLFLLSYVLYSRLSLNGHLYKTDT